MASEFSLDYRFSVDSSADVDSARRVNDLMESAPNPTGLACVQGDAPYSGRFQMRASGNISLLDCQLDSPAGSNNLFIGERTRSHIAHNHSAEFHVTIWLGGENRMSWGDRTHAMQAGDFFVMDTDTPYCFNVLNRAHACSLTLPSSWDRIGDTRLENIFGNLYPGRDRRNNGVIKYVQHLRARPNELTSPDASTKLYDVIALALNPLAKSEHRAGLLALIRNHIDCCYTNPDLAPANVAATFDISVRYLHRLFADSDASFTEYLIEQRLAQAQRILAHPRYQHQTILKIAYDCGFRNINHFGRRFRARYGITPGEFRRAPSAI
jgi:AraC-like DNA-binding protein